MSAISDLLTLDTTTSPHPLYDLAVGTGRVRLEIAGDNIEGLLDVMADLTRQLDAARFELNLEAQRRLTVLTAGDSLAHLFDEVPAERVPEAARECVVCWATADEGPLLAMSAGPWVCRAHVDTVLV